MTKRSMSKLFTNLEVVDFDYESNGTICVLHLESRDSADTLAIQVRIPTSVLANYDTGRHGPP